jgi:hypothetical protein
MDMRRLFVSTLLALGLSGGAAMADGWHERVVYRGPAYGPVYREARWRAFDRGFERGRRMEERRELRRDVRDLRFHDRWGWR